jgi:hypothetical protein
MADITDFTWDWLKFYRKFSYTPPRTDADKAADRRATDLIAGLSDSEREHARAIATQVMKRRFAEPHKFFLAVSVREDGSRYLLDESNLVEVTKMRGIKMVPVLAFHGLTLAQEVEASRMIQHRDLSWIEQEG